MTQRMSVATEYGSTCGWLRADQAVLADEMKSGRLTDAEWKKYHPADRRAARALMAEVTEPA